MGKISIEHVTIFLSKYISKGAVNLTFSPDVNPRYPRTHEPTTQVIQKTKK